MPRIVKKATASAISAAPREFSLLVQVGARRLQWHNNVPTSGIMACWPHSTSKSHSMRAVALNFNLRCCLSLLPSATGFGFHVVRQGTADALCHGLACQRPTGRSECIFNDARYVDILMMRLAFSLLEQIAVEGAPMQCLFCYADPTLHTCG